MASLKLIGSGRVDVRRVVSHVLSLAELAKAYETAASGDGAQGGDRGAALTGRAARGRDDGGGSLRHRHRHARDEGRRSSTPTARSWPRRSKPRGLPGRSRASWRRIRGGNRERLPHDQGVRRGGPDQACRGRRDRHRRPDGGRHRRRPQTGRTSRPTTPGSTPAARRYIDRMRADGRRRDHPQDGRTTELQSRTQELWWKHERPARLPADRRVRAARRVRGDAALRAGCRRRFHRHDLSALLAASPTTVRGAWDDELCRTFAFDPAKLPRIVGAAGRRRRAHGRRGPALRPDSRSARGRRLRRHGGELPGVRGDAGRDLRRRGRHGVGVRRHDAAGSRRTSSRVCSRVRPVGDARTLASLCLHQRRRDEPRMVPGALGPGRRPPTVRHRARRHRQARSDRRGGRTDRRPAAVCAAPRGPSRRPSRDLRGAWTGLTHAHGIGELYRAVLEGVALEYAVYMAAIRRLLPTAKLDELRVTGGGDGQRRLESHQGRHAPASGAARRRGPGRARGGRDRGRLGGRHLQITRRGRATVGGHRPGGEARAVAGRPSRPAARPVSQASAGARSGSDAPPGRHRPFTDIGDDFL